MIQFFQHFWTIEWKGREREREAEREEREDRMKKVGRGPTVNKR